MTSRVPKCRFCGGTSWEYQTNISNPVFVNVRVVFVAVSTVIEHRSGVMKCANCGYEMKL